MKLSIPCLSPLLGFGLSLLWSPGAFAQSPKTQAPAAEVDSDGDGLNDANDPHPLLAEMPRLRWRVGSLTVGWNVGQTISSSITELGQDEQNFLKSSKVEFNRSTGLEISGSAGIKGSLTLNPLELKDPGADFSATIGASFSQSDSLSKTDQQQASILQRLIKREDVSSIMSDLHLEFTVHFDNDDQIDYVGKVLKLPVMDPDGNVVVYAQPWGPDGAEPAVRIPRGRGAPIPVNFRARLDTTQS
ncbi:MAG: hypothetical protein KGS60_19350, partial [Verrucomicrobia bacterium]|nr:hypothetical protein [Verrucomicrobiota bacterium]